MKTAKELKYDLEREKELRKMNEFNDVVEWVEMCIKRDIGSGDDRMWIRPYDHNLIYYFDRIKPILEEAGYTIKKIQLRETQTHWFRKDTEIVQDLIEIKW